jgi:hypothetical protein
MLVNVERQAGGKQAEGRREQPLISVHDPSAVICIHLPLRPSYFAPDSMGFAHRWYITPFQGCYHEGKYLIRINSFAASNFH